MPRTIYIALRDDQLPGDGTIGDPYRGNTAAEIDSLLVSAGTNIEIVFGPGIFQTRGFGGVNSAWSPNNGQRIRGSGMFATVLQLVDAIYSGSGDNNSIAIIGATAETVDVEVSDLTLDCNHSRQNDANGNRQAITTQGINILKGSGIRVRRVRVINFGTNTTARENFPLFIEGSWDTQNRGHNVVEDCIIEQQYISNARELTLLNNHAFWGNPSLRTTVRNNYINGDFTTGTGSPAPVEVSNVSYANPVVTVTTRWPHRLQKDDKVWIAGASQALYNGRFDVTEKVDDWTFKFQRSGLPSPPSNTGITAQRHVPEAMMISAMSASTLNGVTTVTITTPKPHRRLPDDWVRIAGVRLGGAVDLDYFNGAFQVLSTPAPTDTTFAIRLYTSTTQTPDISQGVWLDRWSSQSIVIERSDAEGNNPGLKGLSNGFGIIRTAAPHFKVPGDWVRIEGVTGTDSGTWNGYFKVVPISTPGDVPALTVRLLKVQLATSGQMPSITNQQSYAAAWIRHRPQGITAITAYGALVHGNRLVGLTVGGPYHDLGPAPTERTKDLITRANYYSSCDVGQFSNVGLIAGQDNREGWNITHDNVVDLRAFAPRTWNHPPPAGLAFWGPKSVFPAIEVVVTHDNVIRFTNWIAGAGGGTGFNQFGIDIVSVNEWVVEENLILFQQVIEPLSYAKNGVGVFSSRGNRGYNFQPASDPVPIER